MTNIVFTRSGGAICAFEMKGHTMYAEAGEDIVCAAISALSQTTVIGLMEVLNIDVTVTRNDERGELGCRLPDDAPAEAQILLKTLEKGLISIQSAYPGTIRMSYRERRK